jgi:predicted deacetylase
MSAKYILRFDDITPEMSWSRFLPLKNFVEGFGIKSLLGVVPDSLDSKLCVETRVENFFDLVRGWSEFGDSIAQHGTNHIYDSQSSGILGINDRSEFSGHSHEKQIDRLRVGKTILVEEGVWQPYFMAPAHSFDKLTIQALNTLEFKAITDGYGFYPYNSSSILMVPQMFSFPLNIGFGISTICLHINSMTDDDILNIKLFIEKNRENIIDFKHVVLQGGVDNMPSTFLRGLSAGLLKKYRNYKK